MIPALLGQKDGFSFYEHCGGKVFGCKDGQLSPVNCSKFVFPFNTTEVEKIKKLLINNRAEPVFNQGERLVDFRIRSMFGWKELSKVEFSRSINFLFLSKKGELCIGVGNKLIIKDNNSQEKTIEISDGEFVERACETADGEFVILSTKHNKKSKIYYRENVILENDNLELQLCTIGENLFCCTSNEFAAIDLQTGTFLAQKNSDATAHIFSDGTICWIKDNKFYLSIFIDGEFQDKQIKQDPVYTYYDFSKNSEWEAEMTEYTRTVVLSRLLSDKSVAYITDTRGSRFHILSKKGKKIFSSVELTKLLFCNQ